MWNSVESMVLFIFIRIKIVIFLSFPSINPSKKFSLFDSLFYYLVLYLVLYLVFGFEKPRFYAVFRIYFPTCHCKLPNMPLQTSQHAIANFPTCHCKLPNMPLQTSQHILILWVFIVILFLRGDTCGY